MVVARYFDAMIYASNWGNRRLTFRFPKGLVALEQLDPYGVEDQVDLEIVENGLILDISLVDEGGD